jgi:hypothetical protein
MCYFTILELNISFPLKTTKSHKTDNQPYLISWLKICHIKDQVLILMFALTKKTDSLELPLIELHKTKGIRWPGEEKSPAFLWRLI